MSDRTKELYAAMSRVKLAKLHAEECNGRIIKQARDWLEDTDGMSKHLDTDPATALDPSYNAAGYLALARGRATLKMLRDGY